jgi:putative transposase
MSKRLTISLTEEQRTELTQLTRSGTVPARTLTRARVLLLSDRSQGQTRTNKTVAEATGLHHITVGDLLRRFASEGLDATLYDKPRPGQTPKITGDIEAHLVTLCCSDPPEGTSRWTLRLLANKIVAQGHLETISHVAVSDRLKKMTLNPGKSSPGA